uniref:Uncharacterized protein n=1 Tax=Eutreptiella gymnastica TaxID=73025 RepID=A0A7S1J7Z9_9EUGL
MQQQKESRALFCGFADVQDKCSRTIECAMMVSNSPMLGPGSLMDEHCGSDSCSAHGCTQWCLIKIGTKALQPGYPVFTSNRGSCSQDMGREVGRVLLIW